MKLFVVCFVFFISNLVHAQNLIQVKKEMVVLVPEIEGWAGKGQSDKNHRFVSYLRNELDTFDIEIKSVPAARAIALFNKMDSGCFLGADPVILSLYVNHKLQFFKLMDSHLFAMTLKESELSAISSSTTLAVIMGFDTNSHLPSLKEQIIAEYNNIGQAIKMLEHQRVDAFLFWDVLPDNLSSKLKRVGGKPLRTDDVGLNCIDNPQGARLVTYLSRHYERSNMTNEWIVRSGN